MKLKNSTIGIWGFGRVGKASASFMQRYGARVIIYDDNAAQLAQVPYLTVPSVDALFQNSDYVLPSPGIDIRPYYHLYPGRWLCEVDLMETYFHKPIIAITGSVGKTTTTHLLTNLLQKHTIRAVAAGNIGTPMLEMIAKQDTIDMLVLELSSFQLEYAQSFAPYLALWTNLYPNHLDRHGSLENYFAAKLPILKYQKKQQALVPLSLRESLLTECSKQTIAFFTTNCNPAATFCLDRDKREIHHHPSRQALSLDALPPVTFADNWLLIWAAFYLLKIPFNVNHTRTLTSLEHRLEKITEINGVTFYNDSKSTTPTSTLAAVEQFKAQRILLFLGGLSKGIDRTPLIKALQSYKVEVFCFGKEAATIQHMCDSFAIPCTSFDTLQSAFSASIPAFSHHECVLFSPSGSSYDLFTDYQERGTVFKKLVDRYKESCS